MLSTNLEQTLQRALGLASERHHEYATPEHLLLSLTEDQDAAPVLRACNVELEQLCRELTEFIDSKLAPLITTMHGAAKQSPGIERMVHIAAKLVRLSERAVTGADVLVTLFSERESPAVYFLQRQEMSRLDAIKYISSGIIKTSGPSQSEPVLSADFNIEAKKRPNAVYVREVFGQLLSLTDIKKPVWSCNLKHAIDRAVVLASERGQEYATREHFLLSLTKDEDAIFFMRALNIDLERLGKELTDYVDTLGNLSDHVITAPGAPKPEADMLVIMLVMNAFNNVIRSSERDEVTGADMVVSLLSERDSPVSYLSQLQEIHKLDALNYLSNGIVIPPTHGRS
jgi:ATP-dependent Clp protease ATP-binding subunit ClpA